MISYSKYSCGCEVKMNELMKNNGWRMNAAIKEAKESLPHLIVPRIEKIYENSRNIKWSSSKQAQCYEFVHFPGPEFLVCTYNQKQGHNQINKGKSHNPFITLYKAPNASC